MNKVQDKQAASEQNQAGKQTAQPDQKLEQDQREVEQLATKISSLEDQLKRAVADYRNLEKRVQDDSVAYASYLRSQLLLKLLPVLDHLDQALSGVKQAGPSLSNPPSGGEPNGWLKGVEMAVKQFKQVLADEGLIEIPTSGKFDPAAHEAVDTESGEENKILKIIAPGYTLNGRVVRPAKVVVGKE